MKINLKNCFFGYVKNTVLSDYYDLCNVLFINHMDSPTIAWVSEYYPKKAFCISFPSLLGPRFFVQDNRKIQYSSILGNYRIYKKKNVGYKKVCIPASACIDVTEDYIFAHGFYISLEDLPLNAPLFSSTSAYVDSLCQWLENYDDELYRDYEYELCSDIIELYPYWNTMILVSLPLKRRKELLYAIYPKTSQTSYSS